jgi:hypothetical protein
MPFELTFFEPFAIDSMGNFMKQKIEAIKLRAVWRPDYEARFIINLSPKTFYRALVVTLRRKQP